MTRQVPELSLVDYTHGDAEARRRFREALLAGFREFGFITLRDHDVPNPLLDRAYALSEAFFALPNDEKRRYAEGQRGYTPFGTEHAKDQPIPDLKEFYHVGRPGETRPGIPRNVWPDRPEGFRETFTELFERLDRTGLTILEALAPGLDLPEDHFEPMVAQGNSILRLLHYPPVPDEADPNALRAAPHEDINFLTILVAAKGAGLELLDTDGRWLPVETDPNNLIIDTGDMIARLTNDALPAKTHRVVNPQGENVSRYSMPFFIHPTPETVLSCLPSCRGAGAKYPDITAGEFLEQRLREIGLVEDDRAAAS